MTDHASIAGGGSELTLAVRQGERARILHVGPALGEATPAELERLAHRDHAPGGPAVPIEASLLNTIATGFPGPPGLLGHRAGQDWAPDLRVTGFEAEARSLSVRTADEAARLAVTHRFAIDPQTGVLSCAAMLRNDGAEDFDLQWLAAACLPLDPALQQVTSFGGRWAGEFQAVRHEAVRGALVIENRAGRTGHASYPGLYLGTDRTGETQGLAAAFHLGWSGNHRLRTDRLADGSLILQAGELLLPGEMLLGPGESYTTPTLFCCWSREGQGDVTRRLHRHVSGMVRHARPRPVHFNSWEAVYFDHSPDRLMALANLAAEAGAERFVLDDGWFGARRSDRAGLGDWTVSREVYPDGLEPLAEHVRALGMEMGLWVEPEMVNPDSDLFRAHPDRVLSARGVDPIESRHQLPLDLTRSEVSDHLFERLDRLVRDLGLAYLKWDMNRDIQHPGDAEGRAVAHRQVAALYALIDRLREAHPGLEIESCSSGGARADYGILARTDRVWPSDNNDARARHAIMRGAAHFLPLSVLGNHVGPRSCHITGRRFPMHFRAGSAIFGHMGLELDLADESENGRKVLSEAIALHKRYRELIHSGGYHRLETPDFLDAVGVVAADWGEALFRCAVLDPPPGPHLPRLRLAGLDPQRRYRLSCLWPAHHASDLGTFAGSALMEMGLQLPQLRPDTCLIHHLEAAG